MDPELGMLVGTGATTMVGLMVTESWEQAKQRLARLFARSGDDATAIDGELDASRATLTAAAGTPDEGDLTSDVTATLRLRLRRLLEQHPEAAEELRLLVEEFAPKLPSGETGGVINSITGGRQYGPVFQGRSFSNLTIHGSGTPAPDQ
ncbi:hypothetical protein ABZ848_39595 [Streptomyces sp. NPDC047081]|uniref:hypothetical protein n=1 Tax=Streptomyces sp. NPDC047081 TaxID=3154706 RepID=UPI0033FDFDFF